MTDYSDLLESYEAHLQLERGLSPNTFVSYRGDIDKLIAFIGEEIPLSQVTLSTLRSFCATLHDLGIAPRSQARIVSGIKSFFRFLTMENYLDNNPALLLESPRTGRKLPQVLTVEEIDAMIAQINLSTDEGQRNRAIIETLYGCGLRVSELCNLRISRIFPEEGYVVISGKGSKERVVPISDVALAEIRDYLPWRNSLYIRPGEEDFLFVSRRGKHLTRVMIYYIIKKLAEAAGIKKEISPHTMRHSFATHLLEGGANLRAIQQMLGHENIATTEIYLHIDRTHLRNEILMHHPRNRAKN